DGVQARYVRIEAVSNHGSNVSSGLSDLEFRGTLVKSAKSSLIGTISVASASSERDASSSAPRTLGSGFFSGSNVHDSRQRSGNWESADGDSTPSITYDLGKQHDLGSIRIWNYNYRFATERGAKLVNVFVSDDNEDFVRVKTIELEEGPGSDDYTGEKFELDGIEARYLKLQILESHGASGNVGLAHVSVYGSAISDAPSSVSLSTTSDTGRSDQDGITRLSNADAGQTLQFVVDGTEADDVVTVFANGIAIGSSVASGSSTNVTTDGESILIDGAYEITAVRTSPGEMTSASTPAVMIQIDATNPTASFTPPGGGLEFEKIGIQFDEAVFGLGLEDIVVARNGEQLTTSETVLEMVDATEFYLSGLKSITNDAGLYTLSSASASDATDEAGNPASFDEAIETVARTRAFNQRSRNFSIIPHEDVELLEAGEIAFSFRADQTSGTLFSKDHIGFGNGGHLTIRLRNRRVEVRLQSDEMSYYVRSGNISAGRDYDVVFRFGPNGMQLVLNGNLVDSNAYSGGLADATGTTTNFEDIVIGASKVRSDQGTNNNLRDFFTGRMTDLRIADGNGRLLFSESVIPYEFGAGETNFFNGVDQFVEVSHQEEQELANGAFELTFNTSDASQRQTLFSKDNSGFDSGGHITASMIDGRIEIRLQSDSESYYVYSNLIASGTDYALRFEFGDGGMRLFLDGVLVDQNAYDGGLQGNENALVIAASTRKSRDDADRLEYHFNGRLTDFKMFDSGGIAIDLFGNDDDDEDA
ncbi:MAG: discoidin domain-containing protein, partial [Planctomycetota bacterium]